MAYESADITENILPSPQEVRMNEEELLEGLLLAADFKRDSTAFETIKIKRGGRLLFEFVVRPLTEEEIQYCRHRVTKLRPDPRGKQFPKIEMEVDLIKLRSYKILTATVDNGNGVLWDKKELKDKLGVLTGADVIDMVLLAGEKDRICDTIDRISGYGQFDAPTMEDIAKN